MICLARHLSMFPFHDLGALRVLSALRRYMQQRVRGRLGIRLDPMPGWEGLHEQQWRIDHSSGRYVLR